MSVRGNFIRKTVHKENVFGELSVGETSVGEKSVGEMSVRELSGYQSLFACFLVLLTLIAFTVDCTNNDAITSTNRMN